MTQLPLARSASAAPNTGKVTQPPDRDKLKQDSPLISLLSKTSTTHQPEKINQSEPSIEFEYLGPAAVKPKETQNPDTTTVQQKNPASIQNNPQPSQSHLRLPQRPPYPQNSMPSFYNRFNGPPVQNQPQRLPQPSTGMSQPHFRLPQPSQGLSQSHLRQPHSSQRLPHSQYFSQTSQNRPQITPKSNSLGGENYKVPSSNPFEVKDEIMDDVKPEIKQEPMLSPVVKEESKDSKTEVFNKPENIQSKNEIFNKPENIQSKNEPFVGMFNKENEPWRPSCDCFPANPDFESDPILDPYYIHLGKNIFVI